jgi:hypothetical protein
MMDEIAPQAFEIFDISPPRRWKKERPIILDESGICGEYDIDY